MQLVKFTYRVYDNCLELIPEQPIKDNSIYTIKIKGLRSTDLRKLSSSTYNISTAISPCYCSLRSLKVLVDQFNIKDEDLLYFIRQASMLADHICNKPISKDGNGHYPYVVEKFTEVYATYNALSKGLLMDAHTMGQGQIGKVQFQTKPDLTAIKSLLQDLKAEVQKWQDALRGYEFEGQVMPKMGIRSNLTIVGRPVADILRTYDFTAMKYRVVPYS